MTVHDLRVTDPAEDGALDLHAALIPLLSVLLARRVGEFSTLCEVGCGSGRLLRDCTERLPNISRYVGLHHSAAQTRRNRMFYREFPIRFETLSLFDWLAVQATPGTLYLTDADQLATCDAQLLLTVWRSWRQSLKPVVLALAVPLPASGNGPDPVLLQQVRDHAKAIRYAIEMPIAGRRTCLLLAEF